MENESNVRVVPVEQAVERPAAVTHDEGGVQVTELRPYPKVQGNGVLLSMA